MKYDKVLIQYSDGKFGLLTVWPKIEMEIDPGNHYAIAIWRIIKHS